MKKQPSSDAGLLQSPAGAGASLPSIEDEVFRRLRPDFSRFPDAGFVSGGGAWRISLPVMGGQFRADVTVSPDGAVHGRLFDAELDEEYEALRIPAQTGAFVSQVRAAYAAELKKLAGQCFVSQPFAGGQSAMLAEFIRQRWGEEPDFPWGAGEGAVFRCPRSRRWYALIMSIDRDRLGLPPGPCEILNLKAPPKDIPALLKERGIFPCWHMNKKHWITVVLDGTLPDARVQALAELSRSLVSKGSGPSVSSKDDLAEGRWIVPAAYSLWDVESHFAENPVHTWKQTARVKKGDTVYLYVSAPMSAIWNKCTVLEADLPPEASPGEPGTVRRVMRIAMTRCYGREALPFSLLKRFGVNAVRGARRMPQALADHIDALEKAMDARQHGHPAKNMKEL